MKRILDLILVTIAFFAFGFSVFAGIANNVSGDPDLTLNWYLILTIVVAITFIFWRIWNTEKKKFSPENSDLVGIKGWLILLLIAVGISMLQSFVLLGQSQNIWFIITALLNVATGVLFLGKFRLTLLFLLLSLLNNLLLTLVSGEPAEIIRDTILLLVWGLYILKSVRVKQTFTKVLWSQ